MFVVHEVVMFISMCICGIRVAYRITSRIDVKKICDEKVKRASVSAYCIQCTGNCIDNKAKTTTNSNSASGKSNSGLKTNATKQAIEYVYVLGYSLPLRKSAFDEHTKQQNECLCIDIPINEFRCLFWCFIAPIHVEILHRVWGCLVFAIPNTLKHFQFSKCCSVQLPA